MTVEVYGAVLAEELEGLLRIVGGRDNLPDGGGARSRAEDEDQDEAADEESIAEREIIGGDISNDAGEGDPTFGDGGEEDAV